MSANTSLTALNTRFPRLNMGEYRFRAKPLKFQTETLPARSNSQCRVAFFTSFPRDRYTTSSCFQHGRSPGPSGHRLVRGAVRNSVVVFDSENTKRGETWQPLTTR